jgi:hypothetical protein
MLLQCIVALLFLIPTFLFLSVVIPQTQLVLVIFWLASLFSDIFSTFKFYQKNPCQFSQNERNKIFVLLTKKLGFVRASITFPIIFEVPLLLFFAFFPMQILYAYVFNGSSFNLVASIATSFGIAAVGHLQATLKNTINKHTRES